MLKTHMFKNDNHRAYFDLSIYQDVEKILFEPGNYRLVWSQAGHGHLDKDRITVKFQEMSLFLCSPYHEKVIYIEGPSLTYVYSFSPEFFTSSTERKTLDTWYTEILSDVSDKAFIVGADNAFQLDLLSKQLIYEINRGSIYQEDSIRFTMSLLLIKYLRISNNQGRKYVSNNYRGTSLITDYHRLVDQHFKKLHKVSDYAALLHVSPASLSNAFRRLETTPLRAIHQRIMAETIRLLEYSDLSIKEISFDLGFHELPQFYKFFRNKTKMTPKEYREHLLARNRALKEIK